MQPLLWAEGLSSQVSDLLLNYFPRYELFFSRSSDRQNVMHMSPSCIGTGGLKRDVTN